MRLVPGRDGLLAPGDLLLVVGVPDRDRAAGLGCLLGRRAAAPAGGRAECQGRGRDHQEASADHGALLPLVDARTMRRAGGSSTSADWPSMWSSSARAAAWPQPAASERT